ncbi:serine/threonine-protein kinase [Virgibacillus halotolerans]|uniref:serine/threonine-protein kinase n=1 Tax=Virgibacillus halotolerans TaxID=1071053 RepID=UPI0019618672|nr:serine/threonine-protein kinase [Virgibacillus halotolerans]MBM7597881.1 serine/threonine-protein kinase [Virgibacillus halotolerans]
MLKEQEKYDNYTILNHLCEGGTSHIYEVVDRRNQTAILKIVKQPTTTFKSQLDNESQLLAKINHPNIPKLYDKLIIEEQYKAIVIEKVEGMNIADVIEKEKKYFTTHEIVHIAKQIASLIQVLHSSVPKIVMRDLKPSNLLITKDQTIHLIDFGTATFLKEFRPVQAMGTIGFAAPEQFENGVLDLRSDLFSFGATLFYIATKGQNIYTVNHKKILKDFVPRSLYNIIMKLTETDIEKRFGSIEEVTHALNRINWSWKDRFLNLIG